MRVPGSPALHIGEQNSRFSETEKKCRGTFGKSVLTEIKRAVLCECEFHKEWSRAGWPCQARHGTYSATSHHLTIFTTNLPKQHASTHIRE